MLILFVFKFESTARGSENLFFSTYNSTVFLDDYCFSRVGVNDSWFIFFIYSG